jgi:HSP20 family protein
MMNASFGPAADMFRELNRLQSVLDQVFRPAERSSIRPLAGTTFPVLNVGSTPETIEVMALAPGLDPKSLEITVDRGVLTIAGERRSEVPQEGESLGVYAHERFAGSFRRVVSLPEEADAGKVDASYQDGILRITVAKHEASRPRRIEIS